MTSSSSPSISTLPADQDAGHLTRLLKDGKLPPLVTASLPESLRAKNHEEFGNPDYFFNRELSWIQFNGRVLREAMDERTPLLERLKFLGIFSSNLDEFFMVRVAVLKRQKETGTSMVTPDGLTSQQQLQAIYDHLHPIVQVQHDYFELELRVALAEEGIRLLDYNALTEEQMVFLKDYFKSQIFPVLTPLAVDPGHPFPYISNLSLNLWVVIEDPDTHQERFARVKVPNVLPRFIRLGDEEHFVPLEEVIAHNLESLFVGMAIKEYYPFRITRDADIELQEDEADDLLSAIQEELRKRRFGSVVRMELASNTPDRIRERLESELEIQPEHVYMIPGLLNLKDLMGLLKIDRPALKDPRWTFATHARLQTSLSSDDQPSIFNEIQAGDILLHHPYESFSTSVLRFLEEAAMDPDVLTIKLTLYRTSGDSPVVQSLIRAAENGKQVAVLVELKARFDEENNILWAKRLEKAGVHVAYGLPRLKIHTKLALVVRKEAHQVRRYVHIGTGNYNPKTAELYTDLGLLTCDEQLGSDVTDLFNFLTGISRQRDFKHLLVAPATLRSRTEAMILREIEHQNQGLGGRIIAKVNSLVDPKMIAILLKASQSGVSIDLIVRGICCLKPGIPGVSDNIRVISIVGRLLEHSRIFYFHNGGDEEIYVGSADWMRRNLDRRVEAVTPIQDPNLMKEIQTILDIMLTDNRQAWELQMDGSYVQRCPQNNEPVHNSQQKLMERAEQAVNSY